MVFYPVEDGTALVAESHHGTSWCYHHRVTADAGGPSRASALRISAVKHLTAEMRWPQIGNTTLVISNGTLLYHCSINNNNNDIFTTVVLPICGHRMSAVICLIAHGVGGHVSTPSRLASHPCRMIAAKKTIVGLTQNVQVT